MTEFDPESVQAIACDVFGTTVDWYSGVRDTAGEVFGSLGVDLDAARFADEWRGKYVPAVRRVENGVRPWGNLDVLHRESLDRLFEEHGVDGWSVRSNGTVWFAHGTVYGHGPMLWTDWPVCASAMLSPRCPMAVSLCRQG